MSNAKNDGNAHLREWHQPRGGEIQRQRQFVLDNFNFFKRAIAGDKQSAADVATNRHNEMVAMGLAQAASTLAPGRRKIPKED